MQILTKSDFLLYKDNPLHLWAEKHNRLDKNTLSAFERHLLEQGQKIEKEAKVFLQQTLPPHMVLKNEQTFNDGDYQSRIDVLAYDPQADVYDIYEIKSTSSIKKGHQLDLTFQRIVCEANIMVRHAYIVYVNKQYVHDGELDLLSLFLIEDLTEATDNLRQQVLTERAAAWKTINQDQPHDIPTCLKPKTCPCASLCHPNLPEYPIYDIPRLHKKKAHELKSMGILSIHDIPDDFKLSERQQKQVWTVKNDRPLIDMEAIQRELATLEYPLYFLDYETYNPSVPFYAGYRPYQHMVFQYSLHVFDAPDSMPEHYEFLMTEQGDPGIRLVEHLAEHIGRSGSVIVWNKTFEAGRNKEMASMYPQYRELLLNINERIIYSFMIWERLYSPQQIV